MQFALYVINPRVEQSSRDISYLVLFIRFTARSQAWHCRVHSKHHLHPLPNPPPLCHLCLLKWDLRQRDGMAWASSPVYVTELRLFCEKSLGFVFVPVSGLNSYVLLLAWLSSSIQRPIMKKNLTLSCACCLRLRVRLRAKSISSEPRISSPSLRGHLLSVTPSRVKAEPQEYRYLLGYLLSGSSLAYPMSSYNK